MSIELLPGFEPSGLLLSIRPKFAELIANGSKTVELRRRFPDLAAGSLLVFYATQPVSAVFGIAGLRSITAATLPHLWKKFGGAAAVDRQTFDEYFDECDEGVAIELGSLMPFFPLLSLHELQRYWPDFVPPQSYRYVPEHVLRCVRASLPTDSETPQTGRAFAVAALRKNR